MKQRRVGEYTIEAPVRQIELEEILLPHVVPSVGARHRGEALGAVQSDRDMAERGEYLEIAPGPAAKIENRERRFAFDMAQ